MKVIAVRVFAFLLAAIATTESLRAQCPTNDSVLKRFKFLSGASTISEADKLKEFLVWEKRIRKCNSLPDTTVAILFQRIGFLYFREANYMQAIGYTQQSINITAAIAAKIPAQSKLLVTKYYDLSRIYDSLNDVGKRLVALDSCATIAGRINAVDQYFLFALYAKVQHLYDIGDYHSCVRYAEYCQKVGREYKRANPEDPYDSGTWYEFSSLGWIINSLLRMNDYDAAESLLNGKMEECKKTGLRNYFGTLYAQLAEVMENKGEYKAALSLYDLAFQYENKWGSNYNCKVLFNNMGYLYNNFLHDPKLALHHYKKALHYYNRNLPSGRMDTLEMLNISSNIGDVYSKQNQFDSALVYFQLGFDCIKPGISEATLFTNSLDELVQQKRMDYLVGLITGKADAHLRQYKVTGDKNSLQASIRGYKVSDKLLGRIKNEQIDPKSKLLWRTNNRRMYEHAVDACFLQSNYVDAFYFFERSRAVLLNDQLNEQRWTAGGDILKISAIKKRIQKLENRLGGIDRDSEQISAFNDELFYTVRELEKLEQSIKKNNPLYYQSFLDTGFITLKDLQQKVLKEDHLLVEIFSGDSAVYVLQATSAKCVLHKVDKYDYEVATRKYIGYVSDPALLNRDYSGFINTSNHLYNLIFRQSSLDEQRVIISPDGQYFPFESLVMSKTGSPVHWFLNNHSVSYTYSARFLMNDFNSTSAKTSGEFMGIAPVNYPSAFMLASLPGSDRSLNKIASYFGKALNLSASNASKDNFLRQFSKYRIIQLYTHASGSSSNNEPVIYFADSALYLSELINETTPVTQLIVLSACETGKGINYQGEGVFSFNRGFAAMGIPSAISNLWSVDNTSTYKLMELFYKYLTDGEPTDIALQKAKLEFLQTASREKSLPFYWAAPVLVGKTEIIELDKQYPWKWIAGSVLFLLAVFWMIRKKTSSKKKSLGRDISV